MAVNLRKFMQLIVFFANHEAVKPLGKTKLFKLLYFTDATHVKMAGQSLTGAEYLKYPYGPVPTQGEYALQELQKHHLIRMQRVPISARRFRRELTALHTPNMAIFTAQEQHTLQHVIQQYGAESAVVLSWKSHQEPAWLFAEDWRPLTLTPTPRGAEEDSKNAAALACIEQWYATPDDKPPGYWDALEADIAAHPFPFGNEDVDV